MPLSRRAQSFAELRPIRIVYFLRPPLFPRLYFRCCKYEVFFDRSADGIFGCGGTFEPKITLDSKGNLEHLYREVDLKSLEMSSKMLSEINELPRIQLGNFVLQFELEDLDEELQEKARKELRETPERTKESLQELRELLKEETDLYIPIDNDNFLIRFLRPCKFYPQSAFELIKRYFAFKVKHEKIYKNLKPSSEKNIFENNILTVLPNRDQCGRRILVLELGKKWKPNKVTLDEVFKGCVLFLEAAMIEPRSQVNGCVVIFDMDSLTLQQVWQFTPPFAKRIVDWLQDSIPMRVKAIHIVNQPYIFNMVFALFKPFLREKLRSRIYFHGNDRDSLFQHVEPKYLPECYDGTLEIPRISGNEWLELLLQCDKEYEAINSYGYKNKK